MKLKDQEKYLRLRSDIVLDDFGVLSIELCDEIAQLQPFGEGNEEPIFEITADVSAVKVLKEKHLSLMLKDAKGKEMKLMGFFAPQEWLEFERGQKVRAQFTLTKNEWRGVTKLEGILVSAESV